MKEVIDFLVSTEIQFLATMGLDGNPKVRPFQFMFEDEGKLWFCTSNKKEVYRELTNNPNIELSALSNQQSWIRIRARVTFSNDMSIKEKVFNVSPLVKRIYETPENNDFEVFNLDNPTVTISKIGAFPATYQL